MSIKKYTSRGSSKRTGLGCSILAGVGLGGVIILTVAMGLALWRFSAGLTRNPFEHRQAATGPAGLDDQTSPEILSERREEALARLNGYAWIDQEAGRVRLPIEQAMALIAATGLPVGPEPTLTPTPVPPTATPLPPSPSPPPAGVQTPAASASGPEATTEPAPAAEPPAVNLAEVSFEAHVLPIFEAHCFQCHGGEQPEGGLRTEEGLSLTNYDDVIFGSWNGPVIEPGQVEDSYLIEQITSGRMPKEGDPLSPGQIEIITAWVEAGAPDN